MAKEVKRIKLKNPNTDEVRDFKDGLSFCGFFFGAIWAVVKGMWIWAAIDVCLSIGTYFLPDILGTPAFLFRVFLLIWGNKMYINMLRGKGWVKVN